MTYINLSVLSQQEPREIFVRKVEEERERKRKKNKTKQYGISERINFSSEWKYIEHQQQYEWYDMKQIVILY